ncbi:4a-hydroxytetrahydrobiopterin dehydratase [Jannaschia sp. M317]|uniref:4a-hydroxytetrahydrobiopterin dehydratase n=1 Tax=Jannaschia sp. M317 TaxID=2867011 RepID=UPI0021A3671E|nr:4a-hydroxytetrahydrobiopterin dehydratase [Jannaschia sp. M317]UWQ18552.1 4a-hydroxytetrahydrobiopterin dehydratase [Jannaschia sp. M317]
MADVCDLTCTTCRADAPTLDRATAETTLAQLHPDWTLSEDGGTLVRDLRFKGFAKASHAASLAAFISDQQGHHADIAFGWGYCRVTWTSHEAGGLTENDVICAARLDRALA